jgi:hypothetical protein
MAATVKKRASPRRVARAKPVRSPKKPSPEIPPIIAPVVDAFTDVSGVSRRRMFSSENAFSVNGKIFAMLVRGALVVKLPKERVDDLVNEGKGIRFDPGHGRLMKEWITVEAGGLPWVALAKEAHQYVRRGTRMIVRVPSGT